MRATAALICRGKIVTGAIILLLFTATAFAQEAAAGPPPLTIPAGTIVTVRINEALSSDRNAVGDIFSATLTQPLVAQGIVLANRGQTVAGEVVSAKKGRAFGGVSQLGLALTTLTLADGQNVPVQTQLLTRQGPNNSTGRDVAAVGGTTALGTVIGAAVGWGKGAAIGAGSGAAAGLVGVLLTKGYATVVYPESLLTFKVMSPVTVDTGNAPQAFHAVSAADYPEPQTQAPPPQLEEREAAPPVAVATPPATVVYPYPYPYYYPYYYPYGYDYWGYPYYGTSINFVFGYPCYRYYPRYRYYGGHYYNYPVYRGHYPVYRGYGGHSSYPTHYGPGRGGYPSGGHVGGRPGGGYQGGGYRGGGGHSGGGHPGGGRPSGGGGHGSGGHGGGGGGHRR